MLPMLAPPALACALSVRQVAQIDGAVEFVMRRGHVPGLSIGVIRGGRILCERAYGQRNLARKLPAKPATRYAIGSITKQFTAAAVLQLVADGKLALDRRVGTLLPFYPNAANVTVRELLNQTSGIPDYADRPGFDRDASERPYAPADLLDLVRGLPLDFAPGTRWEYSNTNYAILGMLIEPAGAISSAGALWSTVGDLLKWDAALLADRVLDRISTATLFAPGRPSGGASDGYGFGFFIARMYGWRVYEHGGYVDGFSAVDVLVPGPRVAIVVLSDEDATDMTPLAQSILATVEPPKDARLAADGFAPVENENLRVTARVRALRVWLDVGYDTGGRIVTLTVRRAN